MFCKILLSGNGNGQIHRAKKTQNQVNKYWEPKKIRDIKISCALQIQFSAVALLIYLGLWGPPIVRGEENPPRTPGGRAGALYTGCSDLGYILPVETAMAPPVIATLMKAKHPGIIQLFP